MQKDLELDTLRRAIGSLGQIYVKEGRSSLSYHFYFLIH